MRECRAVERYTVTPARVADLNRALVIFFNDPMKKAAGHSVRPY